MNWHWYLALIPPLFGLMFLCFSLGREFPRSRYLDAAWRAGWRASDGHVPPLNAKAHAEERREKS